MQRQIKKYKQQNGAALILFILLLVVGATTLLVSKLNKAAAQYYRDDVTMKALLKAKEALIGYAVSYPDNPSNNNPNAGPGILPCPDRNNDGNLSAFIPGIGSEFSCSISGGTSLGRLPWRYMGIDEIRDSSGQVLWYALSDNFRIPTSSFRVVNSETPGQLTLDSDGNGIGDDEDIVAMVIAPLEPVCSQNRVGATNENTASNYLEDINFETTPNFISDGTTTNCNDYITFNDRILPITRRELMSVVDKRVLGEVANVLIQHNRVLDNLSVGNGKFPWLSPFADPRATASVTGSADTSPPNQLNDNTQNFIALGVNAGDILLNITDNSAGLITARTQQTVTANLSGGTNNQFSLYDNYVIPKIAGKSKSASQTNLTDITKKFIDLGVRVGDLVQNITDSSNGIVTTVTQNTLTTNLFGGVNNSFSINDFYRVPRLNGASAGIYPAPLDSGVREGHLSFHEQNEAFRTTFTVAPSISGGTICSQLDPFISGEHVTSLQNSLASNVSVGKDEGICKWATEENVTCSVRIDPFSITSTSPDSSSTVPCDTSSPQDRVASDIVRRVYILEFNGSGAAINNIGGQLTRSVNVALPLPASSRFLIQDLDSNNVIVGSAWVTGSASGSIAVNNIFYDLADVSGLVASNSSGATQQIQDTTKDFNLRGVQPGDWIENTINNTRGRIVSIDPSNPDTLTIESKGTTPLSFTAGDRYLIHHNLPVWFSQNNWHQLYYVAESSEEIPGGTGTCTAGTNCLVLNGTSPDNNFQALVVSAGSQLTGQDRLSSSISETDYFEAENQLINDDIFTTFTPSQTQAFPPQLNLFNDQLRVVAP